MGRTDMEPVGCREEVVEFIQYETEDDAKEMEKNDRITQMPFLWGRSRSLGI